MFFRCWTKKRFVVERKTENKRVLMERTKWRFGLLLGKVEMEEKEKTRNIKRK
jgi:hypothetical protein